METRQKRPILVSDYFGEKEVCSVCGEEIIGDVYYNYYAGDGDDNILCGKGDCWAEWMQDNTTSRELENEE